MHELTFYRQKRNDGGVRTGLELDGETVLGIFEDGSPDEEDNPMGMALLWFVDVRCLGAEVPDRPEAARDWLVEHAPTILTGLSGLAGGLAAGLDNGGEPIVWSDFPGAPVGGSIELVCSATGRVTGRSMAGVLEEIADHFIDLVRELAPPEPARF